MNPPVRSSRQALTWLAIALIFVACLFMHFLLRHGLPLGSGVAEQMQFIAGNRALWHLAWFSWNLAALSLLLFGFFFYLYTPRNTFSKLGLAAIALGVVPDLWAEYILSFDLARLAAEGDAAAFSAAQLEGMRLTGIYANGLYNLGGVILTIQLVLSGRLSGAVAVLGLIAWGLGLSLSWFVFMDDFGASEFATASAMGLSLVFMAVVNLGLFSQDYG